MISLIRKGFWFTGKVLKFYEKHGMVVQKVHEVNSFQQNSWLKPHFGFITNKRIAAMNDIDKDLPKFICCSVYGKTVENVKNRLKKNSSKKMMTIKWWECNQKKFNSTKKSYDNYDSYTFKHN